MNRLPFLLAFPLVACVSTPEPVVWDGAVQSLAVACLDRHDAYFSNDEAAMADSAMARMFLGGTEDPFLVTFLLLCLDRHDAAVAVDAMLDELARTSYLASSALLREYAGL
jgi:hypothetical protein